MKFHRILAIAVILSMTGLGMPRADAAEMTVYKSPWCGCCGSWVDHMRANGFSVTVKDVEDLSPIKSSLGVPGELQSCHTAQVGGYAIEGHVPAEDVKRLLSERPKARGLAVPGMPIGAPGMEQGNEKERFPVVIFGDQGMDIYATHN